LVQECDLVPPPHCLVQPVQPVQPPWTFAKPFFCCKVASNICVSALEMPCERRWRRSFSFAVERASRASLFGLAPGAAAHARASVAPRRKERRADIENRRTRK